METLEQLKNACLREISDLELVSKADLLENYIGIIKNEEMLDDISKWRKFYSVSAFYGHRIGKNMAILTNFSPNQGMDLMISDQDGILKNHQDHPRATDRIAHAKSRNKKKITIAIFGGSTIMGQGSRLPEFTIPSLVEEILRIEYSLEVICINHGIGGTMCADALNILMHDLLRRPPDYVVFYDGWNCCSYMSLMEGLKENGEIDFFQGSSIRHIEHDFVLKNQYNAFDLFTRSYRVLLNKAAVNISKVVQVKYFRKILHILLSRFFSIRPSSKISASILKTNKSDDAVLVSTKNAALEYIRIHDLAKTICDSKGIKFATFLQPLTFWGAKPLTSNEKAWRDQGYSSGNPKIFYDFKNFLSKINKADYFHDLTNIFDNTKEQVYQDSGHLNRYGNFLVAKAIASILSEQLNK